MTLWIGNGAVLKSSMAIKGIFQINNSGHELFILKNLLFAIDWNF